MILRKKAWRGNVRIAWDSPVNWPSDHAFGPYGPIAIRHRSGTGNPAAGPADTELRCPLTRGPLPCHDGQHHIKYVPYMQIITRAELTSLLVQDWSGESPGLLFSASIRFTPNTAQLGRSSLPSFFSLVWCPTRIRRTPGLHHRVRNYS
jgi:hypothetical protein